MSTSPNSYAEALGEQLRNVRQQQGLSLQDVEARSEGSLKASVVGAYERGERSVSVGRLRRLAEFYRVPMMQLLPRAAADAAADVGGSSARLRLDLVRLDTETDPELGVVQRYLTAIQARRGDYNGRMLTIRHTDLEALSAVLELHPDELRERLTAAGIVLE